MTSRYDVFLSHATADKPVVEEFAFKLRNAGIEPFLDKWNLIPGRFWQPELENGLRNSRACIIFVGSEGIGPWHAQEMQAALNRGAQDPDFPVIPVLLPGFKKPGDISVFLAQRTWVAFSSLDDEEAFRQLISGIQGNEPGAGEGPAKRPLPYRCMAQPPDEWVHRREYDEVLEALCPKDGQAGRSVGITTALRGAGGFGKTALAQKLCFDKRVQEAYPDGILWTMMGEDIDSDGRLSRILDLIRWWTDKEPLGFRTLQAASSKFCEILKTKMVLVVVDNVWSPADVMSLRGLGNGSALLITTRDNQTLPPDSVKIEVEAMDSAEAVRLLRVELPRGSDKELVSLANRLGECPLLLKPVNRQLQEMVQEDGLYLAEALREIEAALDAEGLLAVNPVDLEDRQSSADVVLSASLRRLANEEQVKYLQLGIFPKDVDIPISILARFWKASQDEVKRFCKRLHNLSLLLRFDRKRGTIRLHYVFRQVLVEKSQGHHLRSLHNNLLELLKPAGGRWTDVPEEEVYFWRHLAEHFGGAGRREELRMLLIDFSFLERKLQITNINSLISDYTSFVERDLDLRLVQDTLRLSTHVLAKDCKQLAPQLVGRLAGQKGESIQKLIVDARSWRNCVWLRPRITNLPQPGGPLVRLLEGHRNWVTAVVVDGRCAISASHDETLRVWDLESGQTLQILQGHTGWVTAVALIDGCHVVSASADKTIRVWDLKTAQPIQILEENSAWINAIALLDERCVISGSDSGILRLWDLETGQTLQILEGHSARVSAVVVVDRHRVVSASDDWTLRIWDLKTGQAVQTLNGHSGGVSAVAMVDRLRIVSASSDRTLRVWDLQTGQTLQTLEGHTAWIRAVAVVDDHRVISASSDGTLRVWDLEAEQTLQVLEGHSAGVSAVAVVEKRFAVSASNDRTLRVWDLQTGQTLPPREGHTGGVNAVVVHGRRAVSASSDGTLRVWDLETGRTLQTLESHTGRVIAVAVVDDRCAVSASTDGTLRMWDLQTGLNLQVFQGHTGWVNAVAVVDSRRTVSASSDGTLRVWDLESGKTLQTLKEHTAWISAVAVVDGCRTISASGDGTLRVWELDTEQTLHTLEGLTNWVSALAVLDNRRAVYASHDGTLRVWELETGQTLRILEGHTDRVTAVAVLDDRRVVSASDDQTLRVWDLESGELLAMMTLDSPVLAVAASKDGKIVVAGDQAGRVHFFDLVEPE